MTRYELQLAPGTKVSKVAALKDDLSYALATTEIRILAPIPGKQAVGVEVPNLSPNLVTLGDIFDDLPATASPLAVWLGKDISGTAVWTDLARMPHLLIAGTTGSGKSGCINTLLTSVLLRSTPGRGAHDPDRPEAHRARLLRVDPASPDAGRVEPEAGRRPRSRTSSPRWSGATSALSAVRARNLAEANRTLRQRGEQPLPYLLIVIDELADLMMISPQDVEDAVIRLAQKSRAVGIHLVLATQRPSVDVITGMIKANVPSRIAFAVSSQTDSRVILDQAGAESLLGQGDMLFKPLGTSRLQRVQGAYVSEEEIALVVDQCRHQREQELDESLLELPEVFAEDVDDDDGEFDPDEDPLLEKAIEIVVQTQTASVSLLQRRLRVGYTRAGRLIDMLERRGIISGYEGSKPRRVLVSESEQIRLNPDSQAGRGASARSGLGRTPRPRRLRRSRLASGGAFEAPDDEGARPARLLREPEVGPGAPQGVDARLELDARERRADADVDAAAEADVLRRVLAADVELVRTLEHAGVAVRGRRTAARPSHRAESQRRRSRSRPSAPSARTAAGAGRSGSAPRPPSDAGTVAGDDALPLLGMAREREHAVSERVDRRLVPRVQQHDHRADDLVVREPPAVDSRLDERGDHVVARIAPAARGSAPRT